MYPALYADDIFPGTPVIVSKDANGDTVQIKVDRRSNSLQQLIELKYGSFFNLHMLYIQERQFKLLRGGERAYQARIIGCFL